MEKTRIKTSAILLLTPSNVQLMPVDEHLIWHHDLTQFDNTTTPDNDKYRPYMLTLK